MKTLKELQESVKGKHAVLVFGRMQPPTTGHSKVVEKALSYPGDHHIYVSHGQNAKTDPLTADEKLEMLRKSYPQHRKSFMASSSEEPTIFHAMSNLHDKGYTHVTVVTGSDRQAEFQEKLDKYNGKFKMSPDGKEKKGYAFNKINVVSAAERNEQNNVSGTKVRDASMKGDFKTVRSMVHHNISDDEVHSLMNKIRTRVKPPKNENEGKRDKKNYVNTVLNSKGLTKKDVKEAFLDESTYLDEISNVKLVNYMNRVVDDNDKPEGSVGKRSKEKREKSNKTFGKAFSKVYANRIREDYKEGKLFKVGDSVRTNDGLEAEVINLGTNYLTLVREGNVFKRWLNEVEVIHSKMRDTGTDVFSYKGYAPKNFTKELEEMFSGLCNSNTDSFALLNCICSIDDLLKIDGINEKYEYYKAEYDRSIRYLRKFGLPESIISSAEDQLLEYAIVEGVGFSANDKNKVASILAMSAGVSTDGSATDIVNQAAEAMKNKKHTPEGWKIWGKMLNLASKAGIKWNKDIYARSTQKFMELVETTNKKYGPYDRWVADKKKTPEQLEKERKEREEKRDKEGHSSFANVDSWDRKVS